MSVKIVLADDHAIVRDGLRLLLQTQTEITVVGEASDGLEAVRKTAETGADIVIMDIAMPKLNGLSALTRIPRILETSPLTRVIILSMHASQDYIRQALSAGACGYILKESAGEEVVEAVRTVHNGGHYLSPGIVETLIDEYVSSKPEEKDAFSLLSSREREVLQLVVEGNSSSDIAQLLYLSPKTVDTYRERIMKKLHIHDIPGLVKFAIRIGLTSLE
jgi:DNA-binding NarL/FixJ family response regulator